VIANGILFCKHHHLLLHDRGYEVVVDEDGDYWLIPPKEIDDDQLPVAMPLKGRNLRDMLAAHQRLHPDPAEHPVDEPQLV
jgi:hypothetical protein